MSSVFSHFLATLDPERRILIQTHNFPDPDAIASAYGLREIMRYYGINAEMCYKGSIESLGLQYILDCYQIPARECDEIQDISQDDMIILVDGQRFNSNMSDLPGEEIACIDHHLLNRKNSNLANYAYLDIRPVGACASIIADYYHQLGIPASREAATLLLYGLQIDTDNFQRGVTLLDIDAFNHLYRASDHNMLKQLSGKNLTSKDLKAFGAAIESMRILDGLGLVSIPFPCPDYLVARLADFVLSLAEVDVAIIYSVSARGLKFSARSLLSEIHCGEMLKTVLSSLGGSGGGHRQMAGGFLARIEEDEELARRFLDFISQTV